MKRFTDFKPAAACLVWLWAAALPASADRAEQNQTKCKVVAQVINAAPFVLPLSSTILECASTQDIDVIIGDRPRVSRHLTAAEAVQLLRELASLKQRARALSLAPDKASCLHALNVQLSALHFRACPGSKAYALGLELYEQAHALRAE